jgi:hypothetical protein
MAHKVMWLTFWVTMSFWLGSAWGCAARLQEVRAPGPAPEIDVPGVGEYQPRQLGPVAAGAVPTGRATAAVPEGFQLAMAPADLPRRELWPTILLGPASGATRHHPVYFHDLEWLRSNPREDSQLIADQMKATLGTNRTGLDTAEMAVETVIQPAKSAFDLGLLPAKMILRPPWTMERTP